MKEKNRKKMCEENQMYLLTRRHLTFLTSVSRIKPTYSEMTSLGTFYLFEGPTVCSASSSNGKK